jgi:CubicO group peptidase (beta-lactamase class C family)
MSSKLVAAVLALSTSCGRASGSTERIRPAAKQPVTSVKAADFQPVRAMIQAGMAKEGVPSVAVAVARRGKSLWEEGFGWADRENRVPATEHTMYALASVTKSLTATALMLLQQRKRLELDRPVNDYLGPVRLTSPGSGGVGGWNLAGATVRRVATHTAGLTTFDGDHGVPPDETIRRYGTIFWRPGERFDYSNLGYVILAHVIARVSGRSYADFLREELFRPLGMTHTSIGIGPGLEKYVAARYANGGGREGPWYEDLTPGANGAFCSAHDLALFGMFHLKAHLAGQKAILPDAAIDAMQQTVPTGYPSPNRYGLGWWLDEDLHGYRSVLGQGGNSFATVVLRLIPSEGIVVAVLSNTGSSLPWKVTDAVLDTLLPAYREKRAQDAADEKPRRPEAPLPAALTGEWSGEIRTYQGALPLTFSIAASGVRARLGSQPETMLSHPRFSVVDEIPAHDRSQLSGAMPGNLGTDDMRGTRYDLKFYLTLEGDALYGAVTTDGIGSYSHWVALRKKPAASHRTP